MYRKSSDYDEMAKLAIQILIDYDIKEFPIDVFSLAKRMGLSVVRYSDMGEYSYLFKKKSKYGFYVNIPSSPTIYYNDDYSEIKSIACLHQTIRHEIKHYVYNDSDDSTDDLAEYFGKYLGCPVPLLIMYGITNKNRIISMFGVSNEMAEYIVRGLINRIKTHGNKLFDYEIPLVKHVDEFYYEAIYLETVERES